MIARQMEGAKPAEMLDDLLRQGEGTPVHGVWHHALVGEILLTCLRNAGHPITDDLIEEVIDRGRQIPGGSCGFIGTCGALTSAASAYAILLGSTPVATDRREKLLAFSAKLAARLAQIGGSRCCKKSSYAALEVARDAFAELGFELNQDDLHKIFKRFKELADKKKSITDADLEVLVEDRIYQAQEIYSLDGLQVACGTMGMPTATVRLRGPDGQWYIQAAIGSGPVDAAYKAIDEIIQVPNILLEFSVNAVTEDIDAIGEVTVRLKPKNDSIPRRTSPQNGRTRARTFGGYGADTDIIVASVKAYLAGLNKLIAAREHTSPTKPKNPARPP